MSDQPLGQNHMSNPPRRKWNGVTLGNRLTIKGRFKQCRDDFLDETECQDENGINIRMREVKNSRIWMGQG